MPEYGFYDKAQEAREELVWSVFDAATLKRICEMHEDDFGTEFGFDRVDVRHPREEGSYYYFKDNGSKILAVAHLDTVVDHSQRMTSFANTADGPVVHSGALDDRLGAYIILDLLPRLGIQFDILLTTGEECGASTAEFFDAPEADYHWMIEFDRGGTDVVMYQYEDKETEDLVRDCGARVNSGAFSDISYLEHLEIKGFNWGVGYHDYHGPRGYAYLADTVEMVGHFLLFHAVNKDEYLPHERTRRGRAGHSGGWSGYSGYTALGSARRDMFDGEEDCEFWCGRPSWYCEEDPCEDRVTAEAEWERGLAEEEDITDAVIDDPTQEDHEALIRALGLATEPEVKAIMARNDRVGSES